MLQAEQTTLFQMWANERTWDEFHRNHYDWWAFPIDKPSSHGFKFTLDAPGIAELSSDAGYLESLEQAARCLLLSWAWDIDKQDFVVPADPDQGWAYRVIRLYKCNRALKLVGLTELAKSTAEYAKWLKGQGQSFMYEGRDLYPEILDPLP